MTRSAASLTMFFDIRKTLTQVRISAQAKSNGVIFLSRFPAFASAFDGLVADAKQDDSQVFRRVGRILRRFGQRPESVRGRHLGGRLSWHGPPVRSRRVGAPVWTHTGP